jgi:uncharacterized membrane protein
VGGFEHLDTDESLTKRLERHAYDRLIMLSDGVFAIAITLSALDIRPPPNWDQNIATLPHLLGPALIAYAIAFAVISAYWTAHRRLIGMLRRVDGVATTLNLVLLGMVALQPAAIRLLTEYKVNGGAGRLYFAQIVTIGAVQAALWLYAWLKGGMIDPALRRPARFVMLANTLLTPIMGTAVAFSIGHAGGFTVGVLVAALAVISIGRRILSRRAGL